MTTRYYTWAYAGTSDSSRGVWVTKHWSRAGVCLHETFDWFPSIIEALRLYPNARSI